MKIKIIFTALLLSGAGLLAYLFNYAYNYYYPPLNNESVKLFFIEKSAINIEDNVEFSIIGLTAPNEIKDIHSFGIQQYNKAIEKYSSSDRKYISTHAELPDIQNSITLNIDNDKIQCWISAENNNIDECYSHNELLDLIKNNQLILSRYEKLKSRYRSESFLLLSGKRQILINTHKLSLAKIKLQLLSGQKDIAVISLIKDLYFYRKMINEESIWIEKAINLVLYGLSLNQLQYAITYHPDIIERHYKKLKLSLKELKLVEFNIEGIYRKEFKMVNFLFCIDEKLGLKTSNYCQSDTNLSSVPVNFIMNDYYNLYTNHKNTLNLDINTMMHTCDKESENDISIWLDTLLHLPISVNYTTYNLLKVRMLKGCQMMVNFKSKIAKHRIYKVYIELKKHNIPMDKISNYLNNKAERDYLTGKPFIYDNHNNVLKFPDSAPEHLGSIQLKL